MSVQPGLSDNHKDYNEVKSETMHRSPAITQLLKQIPGKPQQGDRLNAVRSVIVSNELPYVQLTSEELYSTSRRDKIKVGRNYASNKI